MQKFYFVLIFTVIHAQYNFSNGGSITSLLTPLGIQIVDNKMVYMPTSGGLLQLNIETEEFHFIKIEKGLRYIDLSSISLDSKNRLWLGSNSPKGFLQVYDPNLGLVRYFTDDLLFSIDRIEIGENIAFAVYTGIVSGDIGILKFTFDQDGLPDYQDYFTNFTEEQISSIHDLDIFQDSVYVTTDQGIFAADYSDNLKSSNNWISVYDDTDARQFLPSDNSMIFKNNSIIYYQNNAWEEYCVSFLGDVIQVEKEDQLIGILTEEKFYEIKGCDIASFQIPVGDQNNISNHWNYDLRTIFTSFKYNDNGDVFIGIKDNGLLLLQGYKWDNEHYWDSVDRYTIYTPNSPILNRYPALTITKYGHVAATSHFGSLYYDGTNYENYIVNRYFQYYADVKDDIKAQSLQYNISDGEHYPISIIEKDNKNLLFCNSGIQPNSQSTISRPAIIELDINTSPVNFMSYDTTDQVIDGFWGIISSHFNKYMVVKEINKDMQGNIWIVNPYCEEYGHLLAIQSIENDSWSHVHIPDNNSYLPLSVALEYKGSFNRAWIGFQDYSADIEYSIGGVKVLQYKDIYFENESDSTWMELTNPEIFQRDNNNLSVWSLAIDHMGFLWVLHEQGVQGYQVSGVNKISLEPISPVDFLSYVKYEKGDRIKIDGQNNKWIITRNGVWVIQESTAYWPSEEGLHTENSGLLSNIVYDVAFDNNKGLAYLSTDKGISILQIPFADTPSGSENIYLSPNPFIIPDNDYMRIGRVAPGSTIQIMTITGTIIRTIKLAANEVYTTWDGLSETGENVGTAVYLVAANHPRAGNKVSKIAVIRK